MTTEMKMNELEQINGGFMLLGLLAACRDRRPEPEPASDDNNTWTGVITRCAISDGKHPLCEKPGTCYTDNGSRDPGKLW